MSSLTLSLRLCVCLSLPLSHSLFLSVLRSISLFVCPPALSFSLSPSLSVCLSVSLSLQNEALQLCIKINTAIDRVEFMFTDEFEAEVEESESATLQQYYREAMIQGYNFAFEVSDGKQFSCLPQVGKTRQRKEQRYQRLHPISPPIETIGHGPQQK